MCSKLVTKRRGEGVVGEFAKGDFSAKTAISIIHDNYSRMHTMLEGAEVDSLVSPNAGIVSIKKQELSPSIGRYIICPPALQIGADEGYGIFEVHYHKETSNIEVIEFIPKAKML